MFNSQNLPHDVAYPVKPTSKQVKVMEDRLTFDEMQALNLRQAEQDYISTMREMRKAEYQTLDGLWSQVLTA